GGTPCTSSSRRPRRWMRSWSPRCASTPSACCSCCWRSPVYAASSRGDGSRGSSRPRPLLRRSHWEVRDERSHQRRLGIRLGGLRDLLHRARRIRHPPRDRGAPRGEGGRRAMSASAKKTRIFAVVALAVAGAAFALIAVGGLAENLVYYWGPTELRQAGDKAIGATIRLGGKVVEGTVRYDPKTTHLAFEV